jgi:hypothetical protein
MKVWLKIRGLPIEHYNFSSVDVFVFQFGRLHRCNMDKKKHFLGAFHVMVDCQDLDDIPPMIEFHNEDDSIINVSIEKEYTYMLDAYKNMKFDDNFRTYDDILTSLIDSLFHYKNIYIEKIGYCNCSSIKTSYLAALAVDDYVCHD